MNILRVKRVFFIRL